MAAQEKKQNDLVLKMKYEVIKAAEREQGIASRVLAEVFGCGRSQIQTILKSRGQIKELFELNVSNSLIQFHKQTRKSEYCDINEAFYEWYQLATSKNISPDRKILIEKAHEITQHLGIKDF